MYLIIPHDFAFIGKSELLRWPVIRFFFKRGVDIPVYRDSISKAAKCLAIAEEELKQKKIPFIIRRPLPNGASEYWKVKDLEML